MKKIKNKIRKFIKKKATQLKIEKKSVFSHPFIISIIILTIRSDSVEFK